MGEPPGWQFVAPLWEYEGTAACFCVSRRAERLEADEPVHVRLVLLHA